MLPSFVLYEAKRGASGKEICDKAAEITGGKWKPSPGSVYPLLRSLEEDGLVEPKLSRASGRREIVYHTTSKGLKALDESRKRLISEFDEMFAVVGPLAMRVVHEFDDDELREFEESQEKIAEFKKSVLALPKEKRKKLLHKLIALCQKQK